MTGRRDEGRREGGREIPSLLARQSGRRIIAESSCSCIGDREGDSVQHCLYNMVDIVVEQLIMPSLSLASQCAVVRLFEKI